MTTRRYTVIGAGAVGLLYGTRLAVAGHPVCWVVRTGARDIRANGVSLSSVDGDLRIEPDQVDVVDDPAAAPPSDVVLVALKTTANDRLADLVGPAVAAGATVAMFQNGLGVEERVRVAVPQAGQILGAMCFVCAHRRSPGVCDHIDYGSVTVGQLEDGGRGGIGAARSLVDDLLASGTDASLVDDLGAARWRKLVWNIPFNGLSVVLDATTDEMLADATTRSLVVGLMDEVILAARSAGHEVAPTFRDEMLATTDAMTPYAPSMKLDHDAGRRLEIDAIYDAPLAVAVSAGVPMRKVSVLRDQLRFLDGRATRSAGTGSVSGP